MPNILIVEDEPSIAESLEYALQIDGFTTCWLSLGEGVSSYVKNNFVDLLILDVGLPDTSGFEVCKALRGFSEVPIIFLTARGEEIDRVVGLEIGADDYVTKPFSPRELVARVRAILKRTGLAENKGEERPEDNSIEKIPILVDVPSRKIVFYDVPLSLTKAEYLILEKLSESHGEVCTRDQLLEVMGVSAGANYDRTVDTHIKSIRSKLRAINPEVSPIKTERGFGYRFSLDA